MESSSQPPITAAASTVLQQGQSDLLMVMGEYESIEKEIDALEQRIERLEEKERL